MEVVCSLFTSGLHIIQTSGWHESAQFKHLWPLHCVSPRPPVKTVTFSRLLSPFVVWSVILFPDKDFCKYPARWERVWHLVAAKTIISTSESWRVFSFTVDVSLTLIYGLNIAPGLTSGLWCHIFFSKPDFYYLYQRIKKDCCRVRICTHSIFPQNRFITAWFSKKAT